MRFLQLDIKFKSIAVRWFFNIFLIVALVVCTAVISVSAVFGNIYTERIETLAGDLTYEFNSLSKSSRSSFRENAVSLAGGFAYKNRLEVQVFDSYGNVIVSTTGFQPDGQVMTDYEKAVENGTAYTAKIKSGSGERLLASTTVLYDSSGRQMGAYRWITSLENANKRLVWLIFTLALVSLAVLGFCAFSGLFFIRSIVRPIRDVSNIARKIAMGDFNSRIEIKSNDEIGELCDTINYMASELTEAENLKNDFISSVSHELRTPLTAIRGWGETAKMSLGTDDALVSRGLDVVLSEADRLSGLVEELLDFSRMETGRLSVVSEKLDSSKILSESVDMYMELARRQGIELIFTRPAEDIYVSGDPNRLKQVFINIIDNAVKYTEKGGQVLVDQTSFEGCARITVKDTGVGIPAQDIDRVKEKFYKANKTVRGSGIGLAVADEIIKQHKGLLFLESTEGVGTAVTIVLPLYEEEEQKPEEANEPGKEETDG